MKRIAHRYVRTILVVFLALAMCLTTLPLTGASVYASDDTSEIATEVNDITASTPPAEGGFSDEENLTDEGTEGTEEKQTEEQPDGTEEKVPAEEENGENPDSISPAVDSDSEIDGNEDPASGNNDPEEPVSLNVEVKPFEGTYNAKAHTITLSGVPEDAVVEYSTNGTEWKTNKPTRTSAGTTTVFYRVTTADGYVLEDTADITVHRAALKSASLSSSSFSYNGKAREPKVTVYGSVNSKALKKGTNYTVKLSSGRKKVGKYTVTITGKGDYKGTITKTFTVKPAKAALKSKSLSCGTLKVSMKKKTASYGGGYYQIAYKKSGGSWKYAKATSKTKTLSVPEANTYYVKVRVVKKTGGKTYKGAWSKTYKVVNKIPVKAQKVLNAANRTPFAGQGWCAAWVCNVFDRSGVLTAARLPYASDYYRRYCTSSNRADLKPGMIVASRYSYAGGYAGHIGIYIGNGKVISNETRITIKTIDEFAATYGHGYPIRWGWMNGKKLL